MGSVENITYDRFPKQKNLGQLVNIGQGELIPAVVVRYDDEPPYRAIFKTADNQYIQFSELNRKKAPKQNNEKPRVEVCFHYDTSKTLEGKIVRDDMEEPYLTLIELEDERVISATECQYHPLREENNESKKVIETPAEKDILLIKKQLRRRNSSEKAKFLHGIYKQLVPSKKGRISNGYFNNSYSLCQNNHQNLFRTDHSEESIIALAKQVAKYVSTPKFIIYLAGEMRKNNLKFHANRLEAVYSQGPVQVDFTSPIGKIKRINNKSKK